MKAQKGPPERKKVRALVACIHERIAGRRLDFTRRTSRTLMDRCGVIAFGGLDITNMQESRRDAKRRAPRRAVAPNHRDVAWYPFISIPPERSGRDRAPAWFW